MKRNPFLRYVIFCLAAILFLSIYSYGLDYVFYNLDYGNMNGYYANWIVRYIVTFLVNVYLIPIIVIYNLLINNLVKPYWLRLLIGFTFGPAIGASIGNHLDGMSLYIGKYSWLKQMLAFALTGLTLEIVRNIVVRKRYTAKNLENIPA
jgi:hypothetical protein